jgi:hypothetical protein
MLGAQRKWARKTWPIGYLVRPERFEPPTPAFGGQYSIQLSYGRALMRRQLYPRIGHQWRLPRYTGTPQQASPQQQSA